jgi:hypothetical protein
VTPAGKRSSFGQRKLLAGPLDYSIDSLMVIDEKLKDIHLDRYPLFPICISYVSEVVMRNIPESYFSIEDDGGNYYIKTKDGRCSKCY